LRWIKLLRCLIVNVPAEYPDLPSLDCLKSNLQPHFLHFADFRFSTLPNRQRTSVRILNLVATLPNRQCSSFYMQQPTNIHSIYVSRPIPISQLLKTKKTFKAPTALKVLLFSSKPKNTGVKPRVCSPLKVQRSWEGEGGERNSVKNAFEPGKIPLYIQSTFPGETAF